MNPRCAASVYKSYPWYSSSFNYNHPSSPLIHTYLLSLSLTHTHPPPLLRPRPGDLRSSCPGGGVLTLVSSSPIVASSFPHTLVSSPTAVSSSPHTDISFFDTGVLLSHLGGFFSHLGFLLPPPRRHPSPTSVSFPIGSSQCPQIWRFWCFLCRLSLPTPML
ncbi:hypothetical protein SORBI_3001G538350 [Sorghum bicolor]|jgi:hypothetical protein|uniref:Uncharacterized protein n=1 Tax=Sorghum bicolor TaxID=4558 RepID=A0A1Z5SBX4_SORBI|nr:hypothetical protein SORBI_3001G538350 [Sorghum bicolor]